MVFGRYTGSAVCPGGTVLVPIMAEMGGEILNNMPTSSKGESEMPKKYTPKIKVVKYDDAYRVRCSIGFQTFTLAYDADSKEDAEYMAKMLKMALNNIKPHA